MRHSFCIDHLLWGSTVGHPSNSCASCSISYRWQMQSRSFCDNISSDFIKQFRLVYGSIIISTNICLIINTNTKIAIYKPCLLCDIVRCSLDSSNFWNWNGKITKNKRETKYWALTDFNTEWPFNVMIFGVNEKPLSDYIVQYNNCGFLCECSEDSEWKKPKSPFPTTHSHLSSETLRISA